MMGAILVATLTDILLFYQLQHWTFFIAIFLLFTYGVRMRWFSGFGPKVIWLIGLIWVSFLCILIFFWKTMEQPNQTIVLFWEMPHGYSAYFPKGAGITTGEGIIIFSTAYYFLRIPFVIYIASTSLYVYLTTKPAYITIRTTRARMLWLFASGLFLLYHILTIPWIFQYIPFNIIIILIITICIVAYIAIFLPEGLLLSHAQFHRALSVYKKIQDQLLEQPPTFFERSSAVKYLQSVPPELFERD